MHYYRITLGPPRGQPLPLCRTADGYRAQPGTPADVPGYHLAAALAEAMQASPGLTDVCLTELPSEALPPALITARHEVLLDWECPTPARCRCGAVAIVRETVHWRSPTGPAQRSDVWCTSCYVAAYAPTEPRTPAPPPPTPGRLDAATIMDDWYAATQQECLETVTDLLPLLGVPPQRWASVGGLGTSVSRRGFAAWCCSRASAQAWQRGGSS